MDKFAIKQLSKKFCYNFFFNIQVSITILQQLLIVMWCDLISLELVDSALVCIHVHGCDNQHVIVGSERSYSFESFKKVFVTISAYLAPKERVLVFNLNELVFEGKYIILSLYVLKKDFCYTL